MLVRLIVIALAASLTFSAFAADRINFPSNAEIDPELRGYNPPVENPSDNQWDLQFNYDAGQITGDSLLLAAAFDGEYFWVSSGDNPNWLYILDRSGNLVLSIIRPMVQYYPRDLCFDGSFVYGGCEDGLYYWDVSNLPSFPAFMGTIPFPNGCAFPRGVAYDPAADHFYCANFNQNMYEMDRDGNLIRDLGPGRNTYGLAWDNDAVDGPWLWVHSQNGGCMIYQIDPVTGQWTRFAIDLTNLIQPGAVAGGLDYAIDCDPQFWTTTLIALGQGVSDRIGGFEMHPRLGTHNMRITMTPVNPPALIPAAGGSFSFDLTLEVNMSMPLPYQIWTTATLPNGSITGPLMGPVYPRYYGGIITRTRTQFVPARAPAGRYVYHAYLGVYPDTVWSETHFPLEKLSSGGGEYITEWSNTGEIFSPEESAPAVIDMGVKKPAGGGSPADSTWELTAQYEISGTSHMGIAYDGDYLWAARRVGGPATNMIEVIDPATGAVIAIIPQGASSMWGVRDMCSDGSYIYGGWEGGVDKFDIANRVWTGTIPHPAGMDFPRALTYNPANGHFFCANFGGQMYEMDYSGSLIRALGSPPGIIYGLAFDTDAPNGPFIWICIQELASALMYQMDPLTGNFTGVVVPLPPLQGQPSSSAGPCFYTDEWNEQHSVMMVLMGGAVNDSLGVYEMHPLLNPSRSVRISARPANPPVFIQANGGSFGFDMTLRADFVLPIVYHGWTTVTLPDGSVTGTLMGPMDLTFYGGSITRSRIQFVPGRAPAGRYIYHVYVGMYQHDIWSEDHFPFDKLAGGECEMLSDPVFPEKMTEAVQMSLSPNPFNASTVARFELRDASQIRLSVYDIAGREAAVLAEGFYPAGAHQAVFEGTELASGVYFAQLTADGIQQTRKILLVK